MPGPLSPPAESGGLLHFPSPRHFHGIDPALKIRELRRSLSRSPSKSPFRLKSSKSSKSSSPAPVSPSTPSSIGHSPSTSSLADGGTVPIDKDPQDPIKSPVAPSTRRNRQTTFRPSPMRTVAHPEPRHSPIQRTLSERTDNGNATPRSSGTSSDDVENRSKRSMSPDEPFREHGAKRKSTELFDSTAGSRAAMERLEKGGSLGRVTAKSSPLKRSDGMMHLDSSYLGSPAKRRSLHGTTAFGPDFNIFDQSAELQSAQPRRDEGDSMDVSGGGDSQPTPSHTPRRASSWRRTMQSRHEKPIFARSRLNSDLAHDFPAAGQSTLMGRPRMSLDNHLPPPIPHDSPFSSHGGLPSASVHPVSQGESQVSIFSRVQHGRHPLSRTISQSSSTSLRTDDSPTHIPERRPERRRNPVDFSKSLPVGSRRPASSDSSSQGPKTSRPSQEGSCSTPENFHQAIPHPVAFMSTGLISKRNRPLDEAHPEFQPNTSMMPDTPCKRHTFVGATTPAADSRANGPRNHVSRHSFGTPSTPLSLTTHQIDPVSFGKNVSIFGTNVAKATLNRRGSFLSSDGDAECSQSPSRSVLRHQPSLDFDLPPTPTKQALVLESGTEVPFRVDGTRRVNSGHTRTISSNGKSEPTSSPIQDLFERLSPPKVSPQTPQDAHTPPDPSRLSISAVANAEPFPIFGSVARRLSMAPPATPTAAKDFAPHSSLFSASVTPTAASRIAEIDPVLTARFDKVEPLGVGEFSRVYKVIRYRDLGNPTNRFAPPVHQNSAQTPLREEKWAVKKSRKAYMGVKDREKRLQEVNALKLLGHSDHTIHFFDSWEENNHLYIQTEYCEDGNLSNFLSHAGQHERLDEFRIWKILLEVALGIKHIHDNSFLHLDIKPANILITFEGVLKIADFGMATAWPARKGVEIEGDREYIAPEVLLGECDKPSDIFALGLMMLEIAGNIVLPDNGTAWQKLRSGDLSDVSTSLTYSLEHTSSIVRDLSGNALSRDSSQTDLDSTLFSGHGSSKTTFSKHDSVHSMHPIITRREGELAEPPVFMVEEEDPDAIKAVCRWLLSPEARERPTAEQILDTRAVSWVHGRRRAGATIYEGNWGPGDEQLADDAEMIDV